MGNGKKVVFEACQNEKIMPHQFDQLPPSFKVLFNEREECPAVYFKTISNCLISPYGVVFKNGFLIKDSLYKMHSSWINALTFYKKLMLGRVRQINGRCLVAVNPFYSNYGHWLFESMPRIFATRHTHRDLTMLVPAGSPHFVRQYLELFQFKDIYYVKEDELIFAKEVVLPNSFHFGLYHHELMREMKKFLLESVRIQNNTTFKRYLLSRDKAAYRKSKKEVILADQIKELGFQRLFAEDFTVKEQIEIFAQTNFLVGIHSTGHTNSLFMPTESTVVDFIVDEHHDISPYAISQINKHRFLYILCKRSFADARKNFDDPILDLNLIDRNIRELLSSGQR
jgi:Glycosyltransferase 61